MSNATVDEIRPLTEVMDRLLGEGGCPWDREQTHESLRKNLIEESYEVVEAIDEKDMAHLKEELGDVLLQVVFHSRLAQREGFFTWNDVVDTVTQKMIRRHPHIFGDVQADTADAVLSNWEAIKKQEKATAGKTDESKSIMGKLPPGLPALMKAEKVQNKARRVGFDWDDGREAMQKTAEELWEVQEAMNGHGNVEEEVGDLLFAAVNVARFAGVDPEQALNLATAKFVRRFQYIEDAVAAEGKQMQDYTLEELDAFWNACKAAEKQK